jgi:integrase
MEAVATKGVSERTKKILLTCDCECGTEFKRYKKYVRRRNFLNPQHLGAKTLKDTTEAQCGPYTGLFLDYYLGFASRHYRTLGTVRARLRPFFLFLNEKGQLDLATVDTATVTAFRHWADDNNFKGAAADLSLLSVFFQWAIIEGHHPGPSPMIPRIHGKRKKPRVGRPYSAEQIYFIREFLQAQGNARLRAFFEIAVESGMRATEICRLRIQDLSIENKDVFVGLPNKTMTERTAFLHNHAASSLKEWLGVRKVDCGHDFLFHNVYGTPLRYGSIRAEFLRVLGQVQSKRQEVEAVIPGFSLHRLRHTLSSTLASNGADANTLMQCLGWSSLGSVDGYTRIDPETKMCSYAVAMTEIETGGASTERREVTIDEFLRLTNA